MPSPLPLLVISSLTLIIRTIAQECAIPGYLLCLPDGSNLGGVPSSSFDDSNLWDSLEMIATGPIGRRGLVHSLAKRQADLCCSTDPNVACLVLTDDNIPFCYNTDTTQYLFSDESFGFLSNGTYYAADGTFVDFDEGYYSSADGSTGTFAPATVAAPTSAATATVTRALGGGNQGSATHVPSVPANTAPANTASQPPAVRETVQSSTNAASREMWSGYGVCGAVALVAVFVGCAVFL